jgi:hypothetical protein
LPAAKLARVLAEERTTFAKEVALARRTPLTRGAIAELAKKIPAATARAAAVEALDSAGANAAMVLAFTAAVAGGRLDPTLTRALIPEVATLDHVGVLVFATEGDPFDVLTAFLGDKSGDLELDCLVLLLAAELLGDAPRIPEVMLTRGRWLARHQLVQEASILLGGAVLRIRDRALSSLASPHVNRAKRAKKTIDEHLEIARSKPLDVLPDVDGATLSVGFTVKHETPSVGRNDPCPCGSGKKYKKCHALTENAKTGPALEQEAPKLDARMLGPDQAALLRPSEIAALETSKLSPKAFVEAFRRVVDFRQWDLALRMIDEARARTDLPEGTDTSLVLDALHGAYDARATEAASRLFALLPAASAEREAFAIECLNAPPDLLARIEKEAKASLDGDSDGARGMLLASALLRWFPAIGVYVARGALHESRTLDSRALLEAIEDARDRLLLSPFEPWWDVYDAFFDNPEERREKMKDDAKREKMKEDLKKARAASRKTSVELEKLQRRVVELDDAIAVAPPPSKGSTKTDVTPVAPSADLTEERRRLKTKIDELQRIIGEGQEERRDLRRQLAEREEEEVVPSAAPSRQTKTDDPDAEPEGVLDAGGVDLPRAILVPRFSDRASKVVVDLAADAADGVLGVVAALAAGKPNAWGGVKQLTKVRGILSARAGIHHRVLFSVDDRALDVLEVLHRRDLEQVVARLARVG